MNGVVQKVGKVHYRMINEAISVFETHIPPRGVGDDVGGLHAEVFGRAQVAGAVLEENRAGRVDAVLGKKGLEGDGPRPRSRRGVRTSYSAKADIGHWERVS